VFNIGDDLGWDIHCYQHFIFFGGNDTYSLRLRWYSPRGAPQRISNPSRACFMESILFQFTRIYGLFCYVYFYFTIPCNWARNS
jgi:hypothetical protein